MPRIWEAFYSGADIEYHLARIFVEGNEPRIGALATSVDVDLVAEQSDAVCALSAPLHLGIVFPNELGLFLPYIELPVLLIVVADVQKTVFDERREVLIAPTWPRGIGE